MNVIKVWAATKRKPLEVKLVSSDKLALTIAQEMANACVGLDVTVQPMSGYHFKAHFFNDQSSAKSAARVEAFREFWSGRVIDDSGGCGAQSPTAIRQYLLEVNGAPYLHPLEFAKDFWDSAYTHLTFFLRIPAKHPARVGDIACWDGARGPAVPYGHVAVVVKDHGDYLEVFDQGPSPMTVRVLDKTGLQGYYRPAHT